MNGFAELYFFGIKDLDVMAIWFNNGESELLNKFSGPKFLVELGVLNSFLHRNPYTQILKNKKVLVIH